MTTLADKAILSGADNHLPMLEKDMYGSWKSKMELYMMNIQHGRMILEYVENGPLIWPTIEDNGVTRSKKYSELSVVEATQGDCDLKATNIILQGVPLEVYELVSNHRITKELWERIQLLMQGTSLTKHERECKLYDEFNKFTYKKRKHYYGSLYQSSTPLSITYPSNDYQSSIHHNVYSPPSSISQLEYAPTVTQQQQSEFSQLNSGLTIPVFKQDPGILEDQATQMVINHNIAYQADDLDAYDSDCDEINTSKVALMANLSQYGSDVLAESSVLNHLETKITSDSNIIPYSQSVKETQQAAVQNSSSYAQQDALILSVIEQLKTQKAQQLEPKLYNGNVIKNTCAIVISDSEKTLILAEESHLKMLLKQQDPMVLKEKVNTTPVDYAVLNQLSQDF
uniref:Integrase, catalytic region, zinc finger, CCHC-type, peptidase aspartic, catalytic n=1 Tax=Tanacetum cinerariifolium TaxID=118510 RepID=A0A699HDV5_TANCI|nr:hypothetical protein [Tanacetum cinerariifolium]